VATNSAGSRFVEIGSSNIDHSLDFYRSMLGFAPVDQVPWPPHEGEHWLAAGPVFVKLVDVREGDLGGRVNQDLERGMRHVGLKAGDVDHWDERLRDAGMHFTIEPTDPDGVPLQVVTAG
jgi:catechol 2,3-dioxygenase-like lactoylglutathione lyase family enzyme